MDSQNACLFGRSFTLSEDFGLEGERKPYITWAGCSPLVITDLFVQSYVSDYSQVKLAVQCRQRSGVCGRLERQLEGRESKE